MPNKKEKISITEEKLNAGKKLIAKHPLFGSIGGYPITSDKNRMGKEAAAIVKSDGDILLNKNKYLEADEWAYVIAHCYLHLAFGHFDADKVKMNKKLWNLACDMYITKFLKDMKFGKPIHYDDLINFSGSLSDEEKIYQVLIEMGETGTIQSYGTAALHSMDMQGLEKPLTYSEGEENYFMSEFAEKLAYAAVEAVGKAGGHPKEARRRADNDAAAAKDWFVNHYPLLGSLASMFNVVYDRKMCVEREISIAAINMDEGKIYINPAAGLDKDEMKFVIAHELLHAGLQHCSRCQGRDFELWNVACDYVINGWLHDMNIGSMPKQGLLYDTKYKNWSAESIYDELVKEIRKNLKLATFRGYGKGDIIESGKSKNISSGSAVNLDEFCKSALMQGLEYYMENCRGYVPLGLIEEIRALSMPAIPWDVELAQWFDCYFPSIEKHHTYARPSRRQGAVPDIPRPRYVKNGYEEDGRTFGVVIDTSGSMNAKMIGKALGSIASFSAAKEVPFARVVFCDANAYDAGYMSPDDIAGRVEVKGRGGTKMQPAVDLLQNAKDFPKTGPILVITDGYIEEKLSIRRDHAFLIPKGHRLPFKAKGKMFYFE